MGVYYSHMTNETPIAGKIHRFEAAGLGKAPFVCIGMHEEATNDGDCIRAAGTCDYCGTGIRYCFDIRSADGRCFKVGCDCVDKTGDAGLRRQVSEIKTESKKTPAQREQETKQRAEWVAHLETSAKLEAEQKIVKAENVAKFQWLIDALCPSCLYGLSQMTDGRWSGNGFASGVVADLLNGESFNAFSERRIDVTREIYGKLFGRRNSKAFDKACEEFDTKLA